MTAEAAVTVVRVNDSSSSPRGDDRRYEELCQLPLEHLDLCVVDLETTGGSPAGSRITEIGAVRLDGLRETDSFVSLVDPGCPIPPVVRELTGIDDALVAGAPAIGDAMGRFIRFAGDAVLVAHSAPFDLRFLNYERHRMGEGFFTQPWIDTLALARALIGERVPRHDLGTLAEWAQTTVRPGHRALPDARATAQLLARLIDEASRRGVRTLTDLVALVGPPEARYSPRSALAEHLPARRGVYVLRDRSGRSLHIGGAANLRRTARRLFTAGTERDPALQRAISLAERIDYEEHGSPLGAQLRALELAHRAGLPISRRTPTARHLVPTETGAQAPVRVLEHPPRGGTASFGPLRGEQRVRRAARCLRALYGADAPGPAAGRMADLTALLAGDSRARARLSERLIEARRSGLLASDEGVARAMVGALDDVLGQLAQVRRMRNRRAVLVEAGVEDGTVEAFFVAGGVLVTRVALVPGHWRAAAARAVALTRRAVCPDPLPARLRPAAELIERRLVEGIDRPTVVLLEGAESIAELVEAIGVARAARVGAAEAGHVRTLAG